MRTVISQRGQTVFDISLQEMGTIEAVITLLQMNSSIQMDQVIPAGTLIYLPDKPLKPRVSDYFSKNNIKPISEWNPKIITVNQDVYILMEGNKYSDPAETSSLSGTLDIVIMPQSVFYTNATEWSLYTSWDKVVWKLVPESTRILVSNMIRPVSIHLDYVEGEFLKSHFKTLIETANIVENIKYTYEKYF
jgi:hypothetical protein